VTTVTDPWMLDPDVTFLNHGSFGACPRPVLAAQTAWRDRMEREPIRFLARDLDALLATARAEVGAFLGADPDDLAFVPNATTGVNTVLRSLQFEPGDELLATDHEYNATLNALAETAARDGATVRIARVPFPLRDPGEVTAAILDSVTSRTRLLLASHVTSPTGLVFPLEEIVQELARRGVDTLVDAAHSPGMVPIDIAALGTAWWTGNAHKWLCAPKGAAVLHVRRDRQSTIRPLVISHGANDARRDRSRFRREFDWTGTSDPTASLTIPAAIRYVGGLAPGGWPEVMAANRSLAITGRDIVCNRLGVEPPAPDSMIGAMAAITLPIPPDGGEATAEDLRQSLFDDDRIEVPIIGWPVLAARPPGTPPAALLVRISAQLYNTVADFERLADALSRQIGRVRS
jgi:isopenicillin-N epimerase